MRIHVSNFNVEIKSGKTISNHENFLSVILLQSNDHKISLKKVELLIFCFIQHPCFCFLSRAKHGVKSKLVSYRNVTQNRSIHFKNHPVIEFSLLTLVFLDSFRASDLATCDKKQKTQLTPPTTETTFQLINSLE